MLTIALLTAFLTAPTAHAADDDGRLPLTVTVLDSEGQPIPTAVLRHPEEQDRHRVNVVTGTWEESVLYMLDGSEFPFLRGTSVTLEVSAPGYINERVDYKMRRFRNKLVVQLDEMAIADDDELGDGPIIHFSRDKPID